MMNVVEPAVARILDANFNRAGEALRVMEDHARFALDDAALAERLKQARHELAAARSSLPAANLLAARDVPGDVGAELSTPSEQVRAATPDVAAAAARRAAEALRCLEEYGKTLHADIGRRLERLRYNVYDVEQALLLGSPRRRRLCDARLHVLLTASLCSRPWLEIARAALDGGADVLQLREKVLPDCERLARADALCKLAHDNNALVVINDRPDVARLCAADGVHVGQDDLPIAAARAIVGPHALVGRSTHSLEQVRAAIEDRPDYIAVGPMFASTTKPGRDAVGPAPAADAARLTDLPVIAIGGIGPENITRLAAAGVRCVAVCRAVIAAPDPAAVCRALRAALGP